MITDFLEQIRSSIAEMLPECEVSIDTMADAKNKKVEVLLLDYQREVVELTEGPVYTGVVAVVSYMNINQAPQPNKPAKSTYLDHLRIVDKIAKYFDYIEVEGATFLDDSARRAFISNPEIVAAGSIPIRVLMVGIPFEYRG